MATKDDPNSRIKAADAKAYWEAYKLGEPGAWVAALARTHHLRGLATLTFTRIGLDPRAWGWGQTAEDQRVMTEYAEQNARMAPPFLRAYLGAVVVAVHTDGVVDIATHGVTSRACHALGDLGKLLIEKLSVCPFQTWFGWGHGGTPVRISDEAFAALTPEQQAFVTQRTHHKAI